MVGAPRVATQGHPVVQEQPGIVSVARRPVQVTALHQRLVRRELEVRRPELADEVERHLVHFEVVAPPRVRQLVAILARSSL